MFECDLKDQKWSRRTNSAKPAKRSQNQTHFFEHFQVIFILKTKLIKLLIPHKRKKHTSYKNKTTTHVQLSNSARIALKIQFLSH